MLKSKLPWVTARTLSRRCDECGQSREKLHRCDNGAICRSGRYPQRPAFAERMRSYALYALSEPLTVIAEPGTALLLCAGIVALADRRRQRAQWRSFM